MYGSQYITARATTVLGVWATGEDSIEINPLKVRLARAFRSFIITRQEHLNFKREEIGASLLKEAVQKIFTEEEEIDVTPGEQPIMDF